MSRVLRENLSPLGQVTLFTITGPGADVLPWDTAACSHGPGQTCSGRIGCRVESNAAWSWNHTASRRFSALLNAAMQRLRREGMRPPFVAARMIQRQQRGIDHLHLVLGQRSVTSPRVTRFIEVCAELAPGYGFGFVDRKATVRAGEHAAHYLAGYLTRGHQLEEAIETPGRRVFWVNPHLTRLSGFTMATCRRLRSVWRDMPRWTAAANGPLGVPRWLASLAPFMRPEMAAPLRL